MKKIFLALIIVSWVAGSVNAQIQKGSLFLGGDIGGSTQKTKTNGVTSNKQSGVNISPVFGKAIKDNLVLGVTAGVGFYDDDNAYNTHSYNAGIFLRKYKNIGTGGFYMFIQGGLNGAYYKQKGNTANPQNRDVMKVIFVGLTAYPGISYAISKKLHLETGFNNLLSINYRNEKREVGNPVVSTLKTNAFSLSSSLNNATSSLYLGFRLLIGKS